MLCDICQARTLWLRDDAPALPSTFTAEVVLRFLILVLESVEKRSFLKDTYRRYSPEVLGSIINRSVFWWLNKLMLHGSSNVLSQEDLMPLDPQLLPGSVEFSFQSAWINRNKAAKHALFKTTMAYFWRQYLLIFFPRLCLTGFNIAQPLLIYRAVSLLSEGESEFTQNAGRALIGATVFVYIGIAISTGYYKHQTYRCLTMIRSALVGLIYDSTLDMRMSAATDKAALTLMSSDIDQIVSGLENFDVIWATPIEIALAVYILVEEIRLATVAPVALAILCTAGAFVLSKAAPKYRIAWMAAIQSRVTATASMLSNVKAIRMTGLTSKYVTSIHEHRVTELRDSLPSRKIVMVANMLGTTSKVLGPVVAFLMYFLLRNTVYGNSFDPATVFSSLSLLMLLSQSLMQLLFVLPMFLGSIGCFDRVDKFLVSHGATRSQDLESLRVQGQSKTECKKDPGDIELEDLMLSKDCISLQDATFSFDVEGDPVLRDLTVSVASNTLIIVSGPVGCGKSALLLSLLGETALIRGSLDLRAHLRWGFCAQETWLPNMSIRRIIQGPSEFDSDWYHEVIHACALGRDLADLSDGDETLVGTGGILLSGGQKQRVSLARAFYAKPQLVLLDDVTSGLDAATERPHFRHLVDYIWTLNQDGSLSEIAQAPSRMENVDKIVCSQSTTNQRDNGSSEESTPASATPKSKGDDDTARQQGDLRVYFYYLEAMGWKFGSAILLSTISFSFMTSFPSVWLQWWSDSELERPGQDEARYLGVYVALGVAAVVSHTVLIWASLIEAVPITSIKLHQLLLDRVMSAPLSFFSSTDDGVTVNRFSQDMFLLDTKLPAAMAQTLDGVFLTIAMLIIIGVSSKWTALSYPVLFGVMYFLQNFYLRTSRQLRLLDLESRSSLYTNFMETLQGIATVRAFQWQEHFRGLNRGFLAEAQKPYYLMFSIQRWLNFMLDLVVAITMVLTMSVAMELRSGFTGGTLGLALTSISTISTTLSYVIQSWTMMETSVGALMRLKGFLHDTPVESLPQEVKVPSQEWPTKGQLSFKDLTVTYNTESTPVLQKLGHRPGVENCGKSSLILSILRMNDVVDGSISMDGEDLSLIPREKVRRSFAVLHQDPMLLEGSLRFNLDPFAEHSDESITAALADAELGHLCETSGALDAPLEASKLSAGQKQLLCVARVSLNPSQCLLLDEATSAVDLETEDKLIKLVHRKFSGRTVIAVAHRLRTLLDFDLIIVLDQGRVLERGKPGELLVQEDSRFKQLWDSQQ
ncbi:putative ABC transporter,multidrug resistance associated protein [Seiridium unicorne]|uniref:ABC transporter,multidrug resistance associated protein n=1 Tax=Seiridium unicorne TaxID=138068 RepID=A0ABR2USB7_9PEZI